MLNSVRVSIIKLILFWLIGFCYTQTTDKKPNVLFIAVDDLNDWIGVMGGHPQAKTPNIDALASRGVLFTNAHCQAPVCSPSRASLMSSRFPGSTGIYFLSPDPSDSPVINVNNFLPKRFAREGYQVAGAGKLFHGDQSRDYWPNWAGDFGGFGPLPSNKLSSFPGHPLWDWGAYPERDDQMPDYKIAGWAVNALAQQYTAPFLLGVGFYRPHVPQYAPQKWFDLYPLETLQLPAVVTNDLDDIPEYGIGLTRLEHVAPTHDWVVENDEWKPLVQSYLACVSFVDDQVGKVIKALDSSPYKDSTFIVLFTDHGFHLGEKERWAKRSLWRDGTSTPMIIAGPGVAEGKISNKPVQLLDIYPTLLELTGHEPDPGHEGNSLVPLLNDSLANWPHIARTSFGPGNTSIISQDYRYIHYNDGSEEFYDEIKDPHEWNNLLMNPNYAELIAEHRKHLPKDLYEILGTGSTGHDAFRAAEALPDPLPYAGCLDSTKLGYNPMAGIHDSSMCRDAPSQNIQVLNEQGVYLSVSTSGVTFGQQRLPIFVPIPGRNIREISIFNLSGNRIVAADVHGNFVRWDKATPLSLGVYILQIKGISQTFHRKIFLLHN
ncbi:MAG: sulfatase [Fibrobacteria bacterium]|nr:sulfatase [Fibrobacteria bacterium]